MSASEQVIHMTDRPPVRIDKEEWPVIARVAWSDNAEAPESASERAWIKVRQRREHPWRKIVYGLREAGSLRQMAGFEVFDQEQLAEAIRKTSAIVGLDPQLVFDELPAEAV